MSENNHDKGTSNRIVRQLTTAQKFQLANWLAKNHERLMNEKPSYREVAEQASKEMGIDIPKSTIETVSEAAGIRWEKKPITQKTEAASATLRLKGRIGDLEQRVQDLEIKLSKLLNDLGVFEKIG